MQPRQAAEAAAASSRKVCQAARLKLKACRRLGNRLGLRRYPPRPPRLPRLPRLLVLSRRRPPRRASAARLAGLSPSALLPLLRAAVAAVPRTAPRRVLLLRLQAGHEGRGECRLLGLILVREGVADKGRKRGATSEGGASGSIKQQCDGKHAGRSRQKR